MSDPGSALAAVDEATGAGSLFARLDEASRRAVEAEVGWVRLDGGDTLFRQGDAGDSLYVLIRGRLQAILESPDRPPVVLNDISRGEVVGESDACFSRRTSRRQEARVREDMDPTRVLGRNVVLPVEIHVHYT